MPARLRLTLLVVAALATTAAAVAVVAPALRADEEPRSADGFAGALRPPGMPVADFRLRDQDGRAVTLAELRGEVVVVTFLYATCRDTCPVAAQQIRGALDLLGRDVPVLAISVDPANDTPARARRFLLEQRMTGRMRYLVGPEDELRRQWRAYGIRPQGEVEHSAHTVLLDREGRQRIGFPTDRLTPEGLAHDIDALGGA